MYKSVLKVEYRDGNSMAKEWHSPPDGDFTFVVDKENNLMVLRDATSTSGLIYAAWPRGEWMAVYYE